MVRGKPPRDLLGLADGLLPRRTGRNRLLEEDRDVGERGVELELKIARGGKSPSESRRGSDEDGAVVRPMTVLTDRIIDERGLDHLASLDLLHERLDVLQNNGVLVCFRTWAIALLLQCVLGTWRVDLDDGVDGETRADFRLETLGHVPWTFGGSEHCLGLGCALAGVDMGDEGDSGCADRAVVSGREGEDAYEARSDEEGVEGGCC